MTARDLFVGADGRPRWGWRLVLFALAFLTALLVASAIAFAVFGAGMTAADRQLAIASWMFLFAAVVAHLLLLRPVERRGWEWVGMGRDAAKPLLLARAAVIGALAIGVPAALLLASPWLRVEPTTAGGSWAGAAWSMATTLAPAALFEELAFRGYPFAVLRERFGAVVALAVTSVLFGLLHVNNPGAAPLPILAVVLAGFLLGAILLVTGSLWAAWAAHFAWNWTMAAIFHMEVSGGGFPKPGYRVVEVGPDWLTGGSWGPEGGIAALAGMAAAMWYLRTRGRDAASVAVASTTRHTDARPAGREER